MIKILEQDISLLDQTIQYIEEFGSKLVEKITLIPMEHLEYYRKAAAAFRI